MTIGQRENSNLNLSPVKNKNYQSLVNLDSSLQFLTVNQVANILNVTTTTVFRYINKNGLKCSKCGSSKNSAVRISIKDLKEFMNIDEEVTNRVINSKINSSKENKGD